VVTFEVRYDRATLDSSWEETPEGYLRVRATIARTGCQRYRNPDGSVRVEYRPAEEVARADSLASLRSLPVTLEHPPELLTPENCRTYQRGHTGTPVFDSGFVTTELTICDAEAIAAIKGGGTRQVSLGYRVRYDATPGVAPDGQRFDGSQRDISGNHCAVVRVARGGPEVRLHMDSAEDPCVSLDLINPPEEEDPMARTAATRADSGQSKKAKPEPDPAEAFEEGAEEEEEEQEEMEEEMDGCEGKGRGDSADYVPRHLYEKVLRERNDALEAYETEKGRVEALDERLDTLEAEVEARLDAEPDISGAVQARVDAVLALFDQVEKLTEKRPTFDGQSDREIRLDAMEAIGVDVARFDGKSDDYVAASFETYLDSRATRPVMDSAEALSFTLRGIIPRADGTASADEARDRMIQGAKEASIQPLSGAS
jgi:uncharacterized protein